MNVLKNIEISICNTDQLLSIGKFLEKKVGPHMANWRFRTVSKNRSITEDLAEGKRTKIRVEIYTNEDLITEQDIICLIEY